MIPGRKTQAADAHTAVGAARIIQGALRKAREKIGAAVGCAVLREGGIFHAVAAVFVQFIRAVRRGNTGAVDIKFIRERRLPVLHGAVCDEAACVNAVLERIVQSLFAVFEADHFARTARPGRFDQQQLHAVRPVYSRQRIIAALGDRERFVLVQPAELLALVAQRILRHIGRRTHHVPSPHRHAAAVKPVLIGQAQRVQKFVCQHALAALAALGLRAVFPCPIDEHTRGQRVVARNLYRAGQLLLAGIARGKRSVAASERSSLQNDRQIVQHAVLQIVQRVCIRIQIQRVARLRAGQRAHHLCHQRRIALIAVLGKLQHLDLSVCIHLREDVLHPHALARYGVNVFCKRIVAVLILGSDGVPAAWKIEIIIVIARKPRENDDVCHRLRAVHRPGCLRIGRARVRCASLCGIVRTGCVRAGCIRAGGCGCILLRHTVCLHT